MKFYADVKLEYRCAFSAENEEEAKQILLDIFAQDHNIDLCDDEFKIVKEEV